MTGRLDAHPAIKNSGIERLGEAPRVLRDYTNKGHHFDTERDGA